VINKTDVVLDEDRERIVEDLLTELGWKNPVYQISAISRQGTQDLCNDIQAYLDAEKKAQEVEVFVSIPGQDKD